MKNIIKLNLIFVMSIYINCSNAQIIVNMAGDDNTYPSGYLSTGQYYIKDVNNYLDNFVGTWEYINGNEKFQVVLTKVTQYHIVHGTEFNYYKDGLYIQYKKYINNILTYESPIVVYPRFRTEDGVLLKGYIRDYGRISKTLYMPFDNSEVYVQGGEPIYPHCWITKELNQPNQIFFNLSLEGTVNYDRETYAGQPTYSIPNDVIMTKID